MLDTIREFAAEQLTARGEREEIERRQTAAFVTLAESLAPRLSGDDQRQWLGRLERDHDNIRAVLDRAVAAEDGASAIRIGFAMWRYWQKRGHLAEARRRLQAMADAPWSHADPRLRARLMEALGGVALVAGRHPGDGQRLRGGARDLGVDSATPARSPTRCTTIRSATP